MPRSFTAHSSLESLKKEAKHWLKALRTGDSDAHTRFRQVLPTEQGEPGLRRVQHALALEHGFDGWLALTQALADRQLAQRSPAQRAHDFLNAACNDEGTAAARMLERHPDISEHDICSAVVSGKLAAVEHWLHKDPTLASTRGGPKNWEPLQYLCYARLPVPAASGNAVAVAALLLDRGADPNAQFKDDWDNPFTLITGVVAEGEQEEPSHPQAVALARLLIERGADPYQSQMLYNTSLRHDEVFWLEFFYDYSAKANTVDRWTARSQWPPSGTD